MLQYHPHHHRPAARRQHRRRRTATRRLVHAPHGLPGALGHTLLPRLLGTLHLRARTLLGKRKLRSICNSEINGLLYVSFGKDITLAEYRQIDPGASASTMISAPKVCRDPATALGSPPLSEKSHCSIRSLDPCLRRSHAKPFLAKVPLSIVRCPLSAVNYTPWQNFAHHTVPRP